MGSGWENVKIQLALKGLRNRGTKQKRGRPFVAVNCKQFWGRYDNGQVQPRQMPRGRRGFQALKSIVISSLVMQRLITQCFRHVEKQKQIKNRNVKKINKKTKGSKVI